MQVLTSHLLEPLQLEPSADLPHASHCLSRLWILKWTLPPMGWCCYC
jgi:hypothetical protein